MAEIVPTILTRDPEDLQRKIQALEGLVERVQIDIVDGLFLPERTVPLETLNPEMETSLKFDIHLMVKKPEEWIERCAGVLADQIIGQVEMMEDPESFITQTIEKGMKVGLAFDLDTPVSAVKLETLLKTDTVLILTRKAGFGDYEFDESALDKVRFLRKAGGGYLKICVDGGVNEGNIRKCLQAGAEILAIGEAFWGKDNPGEAIENLTKLMEAGK